jgi:two-component sensor histidine kinase
MTILAAEGAPMVQGLTRLWRATAVLQGRYIAWPRVGSPAAWLIAVGLTFAGFFAKPLLEWLIDGPLPPYITMYASVVIAALLGGPRIGLATSFVTVALTWYFFLPPYDSFAITTRRTAVSLCLYLMLSSFQGWIVGKARMALDALAESEAKRDRAARESVHRIKNLVTIVQAIAAKLTREAQTLEDFKSLLSNRLVALGNAQDVLVQSNWSDVDLEQIIRAALAPFLPNPGLTVRNGPSVMVPARHVSGLNMALYELCTNSLKYGALAGGRGPVALSWDTDRSTVTLEWNEQAPNPVARDEGLGTQLIRYALGNDPDSQVRYVIDGTHVSAVFRWTRSRSAQKKAAA